MMGKTICVLLIIFLTAPSFAVADAPEISFDGVRQHPTWNNFSLLMKDQEDKDSIIGVSYIISGGIAITGGLIGYYSSQDVFSQAVYSVAQTVGIAAVGYGAYTMALGDDHRVFYQTLRDTRDLTPRQRDELVKSYFDLEQTREKKAKTIKAITYALVALLNGYNGFTATNSDLKTALYFVAGVNALASISFAF
jgi:hypothetical protein